MPGTSRALRPWAGLALVALGFATVFALPGATGADPASARTEDRRLHHDHGLDLDLYDALLAAHTRPVADPAQTRVDYAALRGSADWKRLVDGVASARPDRLGARADRLAFWINLYNVLAIDVVVRGAPATSIRDLGSLLRPVWKREAGRVATEAGPGARALSLDEIEHRILRPMGEPRIHAAIVCASVSCPPLRREAYRADRLDAQLDDNLRAWLADERKGARFEPAPAGAAGGVLRLSAIFDWFPDDFAKAGGPKAFVLPHLPEPVRAATIRAGDALRLGFLDYDWSLNDTAAR